MFALQRVVLLWERERTEIIRLALAMGEVVHRAGWFISERVKAFRVFRVLERYSGVRKAFFIAGHFTLRSDPSI
jgi:hypothetical protein